MMLPARIAAGITCDTTVDLVKDEAGLARSTRALS